MSKETQKPKLRKLTKKREGFVRDYVETGSATEAAARNYPVKNRRNATVVGSELLTFPDVVAAVEERKETLREALERQGINSDYLAKKIGVLLTAKDGDGNPNVTAVDKGIAHATKIRGDVTETPPAPPVNATYNFLFSKDVQDEVKEIEDRIKQKLIQSYGNPQQD